MRRQLIALIVASALVLSGCSGDDTQIDNEAQPESTVSSSSGPDNSTEQTEATEESAQESSESNQAQDQIPVSTDRFQTSDNSWVVSTRDNGQCLMTAHEKRGTFGCILPFTDPKPPALSAVMDTGSPDIEPNAVAIEPVAGVVADWVPDFQGEEPVAYLEPGESTEFLGMTMAVLPDGTFKVSQGVHWFTMKDGQFEKSRPPFIEDNPTFVSGEAQTGEVCGEVKSKDDGSMLRAVANGTTDWAIAMEIMSDYLSDSPSGSPVQGEADFWPAPNGWKCVTSFHFPGEGTLFSESFPMCGSATDPTGVNDSGVVAVPADWEYAKL